MKKNRNRTLQAKQPLTIALLAAPNTQILDVAGPYQIFVRAAEIYRRRYPKSNSPYRMMLLGIEKSGAVQTNCGLALAGASNYKLIRESIDTLLVAGGSGLEQAGLDKHLTTWIRSTAKQARRFGSICTGAFLLGAAQLLDGNRVTTHWKWADRLASRYSRRASKRLGQE